MFHNVVSPSRTYVVICLTLQGEYQMKKFRLPSQERNDSQNASWFFMNILDRFSAIMGVISFENYSDIAEMKVMSYNELLKGETENGEKES